MYCKHNQYLPHKENHKNNQDSTCNNCSQLHESTITTKFPPDNKTIPIQPRNEVQEEVLGDHVVHASQN